MDYVNATDWNALREEYNALKERMDNAPMIRWSVYRLQGYEIQGSQGVYLVFDNDAEMLDDLCDYIISKEKLLEESLVILKEAVHPDGRRRVVGGNKYDNNGVLIRYPHDPIYTVSNIEGYLKQKHKMILQPIESVDMHSEKVTPEAKAYSKGSVVYLFPGDAEDNEDGEDAEEETDEKGCEDDDIDIYYIK